MSHHLYNPQNQVSSPVQKHEKRGHISVPYHVLLCGRVPHGGRGPAPHPRHPLPTFPLQVGSHALHRWTYSIYHTSFCMYDLLVKSDFILTDLKDNKVLENCI